MTPLGLNSAAVPEAAALFPLSAAVPPAVEDAAAASTAFGDLLTASFAKAEQPPQNAGADSAVAAFNILSLADSWFAGLNVDLHALNARLDAEETGAPGDAMAAAEVPVDGAPAPDAVDDAAAALMALAGCVPVAVPAPELVAIPVDPLDASSERVPDALAGRAAELQRASATGTPAVGAPGEPGTAAVAPTVAMSAPGIEAPGDDQTPAVIEIVTPRAIGEAPRELSELVERAHLVAPAPSALATADAAADVARATAPHRAGAVGTPPDGAAGEPEGPASQASTTGAATASDVKQAPPVSPGEPKGLAQHAGIVDAAPAPQQASPVEERLKEQPKEQLGKAIDAAPAVQQTGRTREAVAAKLAEMTGFGQSAEAAPKPAPGTNLEGDSQSQSQTQDSRAQDGLVTGISANASAARSADSAAVMPVFAVAPPAQGGARAVPVEGAALPPAPPAATVPDPENVGRLVESMRVQMRNGIQEATIRLKPEHMGEVTISIRVERGAVSAVVNAETPAVQQWLEAQEDKLRSGLSDQGLHLERFIVQRDRPQERREQRQQQPAPRYKQQRDDTAVRFEVLV